MQPRVNTRLSQIIEQGIAIDAAHGAAHAWVFMTSHDIPRATILRVLSNQQQRRVSDKAQICA